MSKRISQLNPDAAPDSGTIFESERAGVSYRLTVAQLQALIAASLALSGNPTAPTPSPGDNDTSIATTAFVEAVRVALVAADALKAPLASPTFTGTPAVPTAAPGTNTTQAASTAFAEAIRVALVAAVALKAPLASPALTGTPTSTTPATGTNTTQVATAAMIQAEIANKRAWTSYTPGFTASSGTYTAASATGSYMVAFGICFWRATGTITTKGAGATPRIGLPLPALAGMAGAPIPARAINVNFKSGSATIEAGLTTALISAADTTDLGSADGAIIHVMGAYPIA